YELISGRLPFEGLNASDIAANIIRVDPALITRRGGGAVPPRLAAIVQRAMAKDRDQRYARAQHLLDDLQQLRGDLDRDAALVVGSEETQSTTTEALDLDFAAP